MGDIEVRQVGPDEGEAFIRSVKVPFLEPPATGRDPSPAAERAVRRLELPRCWVAVDDGRFVANCGVRTMDVTVPGRTGGLCPVVPMGGVTMVGVHPTHRRRGILRRLMDVMLTDSRRRGEPLAGLIASESVIYGRFGFGLASESATVEIDTREAVLLRPVPRLELSLVDRDEAAKVLPELFDRQRPLRAGEVCRPAPFWEQFLADDDPQVRSTDGGLFVAAHPDGYVAYRASGTPDTGPRGRITVFDLRGVEPEVEAGLWQFVLGIDLTDQVRADRRPVDEPFRWRLADLRQLRTVRVDDRLYLRVLDMAAFELRGYQAEGRLVLDVGAPAVDGGSEDGVPGRWVLDVGPDGAACRRAGPGEAADLRLDVTALGSLYMGGFAASTLAAAGRVEELRPGRLAVADRIFTTRPAPCTVTGF